MIKNFTPRLYQETILATAAQKNTLIVLPTGLGKTNIFVMVAAQRLKNHPESKVLLLGPTRPLIEQYYNVFLNNFEIQKEKMAIFTGMISPEKRAEMWKESQIIFSTPQGLENDIIGSKIDLSNVSLLGFDEAHRAVKDYSYVWIAKQYIKTAKFPRIIGMTASPGSDMETISEVCKNLNIEDIEVRTDSDPDVKPYVQDIDTDWVKVDLPENFREVQKYLQQCFKSKLEEVKKLGYLSSSQINAYSKKEMLGLMAGLHSEIAKGNRDFDLMKSISVMAEAMKVEHGIELLETQGITSLKKYFDNLAQEAAKGKVKAVQNLVKDINFRRALVLLNKLYEEKIEHPKLEELKRIVADEIALNKEIKIIIFNQYRDSGVKIVEELSKVDGVTAKLFVGQAKKKDTGLTQKKQKEILDEFRQGKFNTIVMTSVGEEGLDIPRVDLVIFYEPIPSAIRHIQRRGRTGRQEKGRVLVLMAKNTRDEAYRWVAHYKEKRMHSTLKTLKEKMYSFFGKKDPSLGKFLPEEDKIKVIADHREKSSGVIKELIELGAVINLETISVGDYMCSSRVGIEFKTQEDFVNSIIDGRLLQQLKELKKNYERPLVIVEGEQDIYSVRRVHPNALRGMLATIAISYGIPIIYTRNFKETAALIHIIAKREQEETGKEFSMHADKKPATLQYQQEYVVSSLPSVGPNLSKELLKRFKSVKNIFNASEEELKETPKVGDKIAKSIKEVVDKEYLE